MSPQLRFGGEGKGSKVFQEEEEEEKRRRLERLKQAPRAELRRDQKKEVFRTAVDKCCEIISS